MLLLSKHFKRNILKDVLTDRAGLQPIASHRAPRQRGPRYA